MLKQRGRQVHPGFGTPEYTLASCPVLASVGRAGHNGPCHHDEGWHPGHLITYWHWSPHSSRLTRCTGSQSSSGAVVTSPCVPINTLEPAHCLLCPHR